MKRIFLTLTLLLAAGGLAFAGGGGHQGGGEKHNGDLLYALLFWVALAQGVIAVGAVATYVKAQWILPVKRQMLSVYPVLWVLAAGFLAWGFTGMDGYHWMKDQGRWLNKDYFLLRNAGCMFVTALLGTLLARESARMGPKRRMLAILYLFSYVATQSLVAFDWVMSLEYPWFSTLFGGFFFMEAFLSGFCVAAIFWFGLWRKTPMNEFETTRAQRRDMAAMQFGFSVFWAYLMFSQVLVIWYGNLPEETTFFMTRIAEPAYKWPMYSLLFIMFVFPFCILISRKVKETPPLVFAMGLNTLFGLLIERYVYLAPNLHLTAVAGVYWVVLFVVFAACVAKRESLLPPPGEGALEPAHGHAH